MPRLLLLIAGFAGCAGALRLSAGGKWAFGGTGHGPRNPSYSPYFGYLVNVMTGEQKGFGLEVAGEAFEAATTGQPVADDGTAVFSDVNAIVILHGAEIRRIPAEGVCDSVSQAVIDAAGRTIVFTTHKSINISDLASRGYTFSVSTRLLHIADAKGSGSSLLVADGYSPSITDDGGKVLYLSDQGGIPQAYIINIDGSEDRQITNDPDGITIAIVAGNGGIAYAVTGGGRLLKILLPVGSAREIIPRTPFMDSVLPRAPALAPDKLVSLPGIGLSDTSYTYTASPPLPYTLGGVQLTIQGKPTRILSVTPSQITVLVPPDVTPSETNFGTSPIKLEIPSSSPFDFPDLSGFIEHYAPELLVGFRGILGAYILAAHEDWSALVTFDNPALPGEVLHAYGTGLGSSVPSVPYGVGAPAQEPLARLAIPFVCDYNNFTMTDGGRVEGTRVPVEVLFQGLAPGMAGYYQFDYRVPADYVRDAASFHERDDLLMFSIVCERGAITDGIRERLIFGQVPVRSFR